MKRSSPESPSPKANNTVGETPAEHDGHSRPLSRREFLGAALLAGAGLTAGCRTAGLSTSSPRRRPGWRRVWAMSDPHVGLGGRGNDGRDGADWLRLCLDDLRENVGDVDYVAALGDLTHHAGPEDELREYVRVRRASHIPVWYEMAGNHDYAAIPSGRWAKHIGSPPRYTVLDGTLAWFFVSAERGKSDGLITAPTEEWLVKAIRRHQDTHNIVVCSHQAVRGTVSGSRDESASLNDPWRVERILRSVRIDLWLCGHIHAGRRTAGYAREGAYRTYVNVASAGHAYGTRACNGYVLDMAEGGNEMRCRCRDHGRGQYVKNQEVRVTFPHELRFSARPAVVPASV